MFVPKAIIDKANIVSKVTLKRLVNILLNIGSYIISRVAGQSYHAGFPSSISIEPTTSCNLRCPECPSGLRSFTRPTGMLSEPLFQKVIDGLQGTLLYLTFYFQGEPYLNGSFIRMVKYASSKKIYTSTSTNGHYLDELNCRLTIESGLDRMIVSIDGATQETYSSYRVGGYLEKVLLGVKNLNRIKKEMKSNTPYIIFQFLVVKPNEHEIPEILRIAKELDVDEVRLKTAQIYNYENGSNLIPENEKYARYRKGKEGKYVIKNIHENNCWRMWNSCVITWDGKIVPCCFDKDAHHEMGNVSNIDFNTIWRGKAYDSFRNSLLRSRSEIAMCKNCSEGTKVWG